MGLRPPESFERLPESGLMRVSASGVHMFGYCSRGSPPPHAMYFGLYRIPSG
jgi:hypothetical protein